MNLWPSAFLIEGIDNQEEYNEFIKKYNLLEDNSNNKFLTSSNLKKAIRHPKKAIKKVLKKVIEKILA